MVGMGIGLVLQTWLANLFAHGFPIAIASWISAGLLCIIGAAAVILTHRRVELASSWDHWALLAALTLLLTAIGRGLAIFDDYQNLPTISLMATGDVPPHFALNPSLNFGYHYFLLLFSAQLMRLGNMLPWTALDVARGLILALPLMLAGWWGYRLTHRPLAAVLTGAMLAFAGGARWLLLLLPPSWLVDISANVQLIGSASTSAPSLADAMLSNWKIDGAGPIAFPFAFYTGINQPYVMAYTGIAGSGILILLLLLLTANRSLHRGAGWVMLPLLASLALANEIAFLLLVFGSFILAVFCALRMHSWRLPGRLAVWLAVLLGAIIIAAFQGGLLTEIVRSRLMPRAAEASYFDTSLSFVWPPAVVSAHLGSLSIASLPQLVVALAEIGPVILVTPLLFAWWRKSFRLGNWYEASLIASSAGTLAAIFITFKGPLFTAWPRLLSGWFFACMLYAVPLLWTWTRRRNGWLQALALAITVAACLGGLVLFAIELLAVQRPVLATFISPLDAKMSAEYWNRLEHDVLIFDPVVYRSPTVFGRFTDSSPSWYTKDPAWQALDASPDPRAISAAGFDYMYFDKDYWDELTPAQQALLSAACVRQVRQVDGIHSEQNYAKDFRRLLDIRGCR